MRAKPYFDTKYTKDAKGTKEIGFPAAPPPRIERHFVVFVSLVGFVLNGAFRSARHLSVLGANSKYDDCPDKGRGSQGPGPV